MYENDLALKPPVTDTVTLQGKQNRKKLLRAWVEIGAWVADYRRKHGTQITDPSIGQLSRSGWFLAAQLRDMKAHKLFVKIESAREMYQAAIGAHPDQSAEPSLCFGGDTDSCP
jgi:ubiquitin carboxyl-terminal hydrolase 25/28